MSNENPTTTTPVAVVNTPPAQSISLGSQGLQMKTMEDLWRFSKYVAVSGFAPKGMEKAESIFVAIQFGLELGISPIAALQNLAVINGRPGIYGDMALSLVRQSGYLEKYSQRWEGTGDMRKAIVTALRKGDAEPISSSFSVADAKTAGLWGKQGPWSQYPDRMLLFRARGFALRDGFGDVLKGLRTTEELQDIPREEKNVTPPKAEKAAEIAQADDKAPFPEEKKAEGAT